MDERTPALQTLLSGFTPRIEAQETHQEFLHVVKPDAALLPITHARRLVKREETAESWSPDSVTIVTTTTVADDALARLGFETERDIVEAFEPTAHIPTDHAVYGDDPQEKREEGAAACARGTRWMDAQLAESRTAVVPLIKGSTPQVRSITERAAAGVDADMVGFYAGQYETTAWAKRKATLNHDLRGIARETNGLPVLVIGATGWRTVVDMPENVVGVAGLWRWRTAVEPRTSPPEEMRGAYDSVVADVEAWLPGQGTRPAEVA